MLPNYDKRMKSMKEITARMLLPHLPASVPTLATIFTIPTDDVLKKLIELQRQGLADTNGTIWYPIRMEKSIKE